MPHPEEIARTLLAACLQERELPSGGLEDLIAQALSPDDAVACRATSALLGILAEGLADRFDPALAHAYAQIFSQVFAAADDSLDSRALYARYLAIRQTWPLTLSTTEVEQVFVLSRVTLGADAGITSTFLNAARQRFPHARIKFAGPEKNYQLFAAAPWLEFFPLPYHRRTLRETLLPWRTLRDSLPPCGALVLDPDSRILQLGLLPLPQNVDYGFFESRSYEAAGTESLYELAQRWLEDNLQVRGPKPFLAPRVDEPLSVSPRTATVSFGVGDNPGKRLSQDFESRLLRLLVAKGFPVLLDEGGSPEEAARARAAVEGARLPATAVHTFRGPFAAFAGAIARSALYVGYDSAGQHAAAVAGIPSLTVFTGYPNERFLRRWSPSSPRATVIPVPDPDAPTADVLARVEAALDALAVF